MQTSSSLLSVFDSHINPVLALNRETGFITFGNKKATELFKLPSNLDRLTLADVCTNIKPSGSEEYFYHSTALFKLNRLDSNQFPDTILFFEPMEEQPGKKSMQTGELAASLVAHLFRSPLTALIGLAEMVSTSTEENKELISKALTDGLHRIGGFVNDLDDFTKVDKLNLQAVNLGVLLQTFVNQLESNARKAIQLDLMDSSKSIQTDAKLVQEILAELIKNALEYGIDELSNIEIHQKSASSVWIGNAGMITKEIESGLFQPFFSTKSQNWGLGLSKAVRKAQALGGTLRLIENSRIKGIIFELALPND